MTLQAAYRHAYQMNGIGEFDPNLITDYTNATANLVNAIRGNGNGSSSSSTTNDNSTPQVIYVPTTTTSTSNDNTLLYVALAGVVALAALFAFKK